MEDISGWQDAAKLLRQRVKDLAASRFEKYYHHSTGTHIVKQLEGTEFEPFAIKGVGEFADEAYRDYIEKLNSYLEQKNEHELRGIEIALRKHSAAAHKKVELQLQLPEKITADLNAQAKAKNLSVASYVSIILSRNLPDTLDPQTVAEWYASVKQHSGEVARDGNVSLQTMTFPINSFDIVRLERVVHQLPGRGNLTMNDVMCSVIMATQSESRLTH